MTQSAPASGGAHGSQTLAVQVRPAVQSPGAPQPPHAAQGGQLPPQSMSVSLPFMAPSEQLLPAPPAPPPPPLELEEAAALDAAELAATELAVAASQGPQSTD